MTRFLGQLALRANEAADQLVRGFLLVHIKLQATLVAMKCLVDTANVAAKSFSRRVFKGGRWKHLILTIIVPDNGGGDGSGNGRNDDDDDGAPCGRPGGPSVGPVPLQPLTPGAVATVISLDEENEQTELDNLDPDEIQWARSEGRQLGYTVEKVILPPVMSNWNA